jgi:hypothetical protein
METILLQAVFALIGSIIGAAIAGYLGVRFGISQFVGEKAFERRLDWFEKTIREIIAARYLYNQMALVHERFDKKGVTV